MRVLRDQKMPAKALNPISWRAKEIHMLFVLFVFLFVPRLRLSQMVTIVRCLNSVEYGWIVPAVKINVCLDEKMVGKQPPAIAEEHIEHARRGIPIAPLRHARFPDGSQAEGQGEQKQ